MPLSMAVDLLTQEKGNLLATQPPFLAFTLSKSIKPTFPNHSDISASPLARAARGGSERAQIFQARALRGKMGG